MRLLILKIFKNMMRDLMKYKSAAYMFFLAVWLFFPAGCSWSKPIKVRVLFIGNSLTSANNLPGMIADLAVRRNFRLEYDAYLPGGYNLSQHAGDPGLINKIKQGNWDFVVLQEQSQRPAFSQTQVEAQVYPFAEKLSLLIKEASPKAQVVFYETMAKKNGDTQNAKFFPGLATYAGMQEKINLSYAQMARRNNGFLVPVGVVWQKARLERPDIELYSDDTHQTSPVHI
jgi:hypothetical protein